MINHLLNPSVMLNHYNPAKVNAQMKPNATSVFTKIVRKKVRSVCLIMTSIRFAMDMVGSSPTRNQKTVAPITILQLQVSIGNIISIKTKTPSNGNFELYFMRN